MRVGRRVVQLARDAQPFLARRRRHLVPGLLRAAGTFLNLGDVARTELRTRIAAAVPAIQRSANDDDVPR